MKRKNDQLASQFFDKLKTFDVTRAFKKGIKQHYIIKKMF